jgi:hypothetical protein
MGELGKLGGVFLLMAEMVVYSIPSVFCGSELAKANGG